LKSELEVVDDFVNDRMIFYKSDDLKESFLRDRIARIMYLPTRSASSYSLLLCNGQDYFCGQAVVEFPGNTVWIIYSGP